MGTRWGSRRSVVQDLRISGRLGSRQVRPQTSLRSGMQDCGSCCEVRLVLARPKCTEAERLLLPKEVMVLQTCAGQ